MAYLFALKAAILAVILSVTLWLLRRSVNLYRNYVQARKLGLPIIICPFNWQDLYWSLFRGPLQWMAEFPFDLGAWIELSTVGWPAEKKYHPHRKYGNTFVIVSPSCNELWVNDPDVAAEVMNRVKTWLKPKKFYIPFEIFGHNVLSSNGTEWQRQRKIVNSAFTEQTYTPVWQATTKQTQQMLQVALGHGKPTNLFDVKASIDTVTMHVLAAGVFGHEVDFESGSDKIRGNHTMSFAASQRWFLQNFIPIILFGSMKVPSIIRPLLPTKLKEILANKQEYERYLNESISELRQEDEKMRNSTDLLTKMIQSHDEGDEGEPATAGRKIYLTDAELRSNLFVLNMAGFETTASSLSFSIPYLAVFPATQEWVLEEVRAINKDRDQSTYEESFPKTVRLRAVMYETLRLHGALNVMVKQNSTDQVLQLADRQLAVPRNTLLCLNFTSIHQDPKHWGDDGEEWRPQRWVEIDPDTGKERLKDAPKSTIYAPWTAGLRVCPGKKFSQVEFTAAMLAILSEYRIELAMKRGQTEGDARKHLFSVIRDIDGVITPKFRRPKDGEVLFVKR